MGLDPETLKGDIQELIENVIPDAAAQALAGTYDEQSQEIQDTCKKFGESLTEMIAEPIANGLAAAIDCYIRQAEIFGKFQILGVATVGGPTSQCQVVPLPITVDTMPVGMGGGNMPLPNTLYLGIK